MTDTQHTHDHVLVEELNQGATGRFECACGDEETWPINEDGEPE